MRLEEFSVPLGRQVEAIRRAMEGVLSDKPAAEGEFDAEGASGAIARLRRLLECCDGDTGEAFSAVERMLGSAVAKSQLNALGSAIGEFDFEAALAKLDEVVEGAYMQQARE